jgi:hypothetical protein
MREHVRKYWYAQIHGKANLYNGKFELAEETQKYSDYMCKQFFREVKVEWIFYVL